MYRHLTIVLAALITLFPLLILEGIVGNTGDIANRGGGGRAGGGGAARAGGVGAAGRVGGANLGARGVGNQIQRTPALNRAAYGAGVAVGSTVTGGYYYPTTPYNSTYPTTYVQPVYYPPQYVQPGTYAPPPPH